MSPGADGADVFGRMPWLWQLTPHYISCWAPWQSKERGGKGYPIPLAIGCCDSCTLLPAGNITAGAKATHDQILEWLNLQEAQFARLDGLNATEAARQAAAREHDAASVVRRPPMGGAGAGLGGISALNSAQQVRRSACNTVQCWPRYCAQALRIGPLLCAVGSALWAGTGRDVPGAAAGYACRRIGNERNMHLWHSQPQAVVRGRTCHCRI